MEQQIEELEQWLSFQAMLYHNGTMGDKHVSDEEYDLKLQELKNLYAAHPELKRARSIVDQVGAPVDMDENRRVRHVRPMLSLNATSDTQTLGEFFDGTHETMSAEYKIDGIALSVHYDDYGVLQKIVTRGDGVEGVYVGRYLGDRAIPFLIMAGLGELEIRGEVYIRKSEFKKLNEYVAAQGLKPYKSTRNAAAGIVRKAILDPACPTLQFLSFKAYTAMGYEFNRIHKTQVKALSRLRSLGFDTAMYCTVDTRLDVLQTIEEISLQRETLDFDIDGVVFKVDDLEKQATLGSGNQHPNWALAYKFAPRSGISIVQDVHPQVGRTGVITPVAQIEPLNIEGVTIDRINLHNYDEVARLKLGIGNLVEVSRRNDVIPKIEKIIYHHEEFHELVATPTHCPACDTPLIKTGAFLVCSNMVGCPAQLVTRINYFTSISAVDIKGISTKTIEKLIEAGLLKDPADLYNLHHYMEELIELVGRKTADKLVTAIDRRRNISLDVFLTGLAIPGVGAINARGLARHYHNLDRFLTQCREGLSTDHTMVSGIGIDTAKEIQQYVNSSFCQNLITKFKDYGVVVEDYQDVSIPADQKTIFTHKVVVVTGSIPGYTRLELSALFRDMGAIMEETVNQRTHYLIAGDVGSSKYTKAKKLGVEILTADEFLTQLNRRQGD